MTSSPIVPTQKPLVTTTPAVTETPVVTITPATTSPAQDIVVPTPNVHNASVTVKLSTTSKKLGVGESFTLNAKASTGKVTYKTSNKAVATVSQSGKVTAKKAGTAKITVSAAGVTKTCTVKVYKAPTKASLQVFGIKNVLKKGKTYKIKTFLSDGFYCNKITFTSSNKKVVTVSSNGTVKAKKKGKATITIKTSTGYKKSIKVTVK